MPFILELSVSGFTSFILLRIVLDSLQLWQWKICAAELRLRALRTDTWPFLSMLLWLCRQLSMVLNIQKPILCFAFANLSLNQCLSSLFKTFKKEVRVLARVLINYTQDGQVHISIEPRCSDVLIFWLYYLNNLAWIYLSKITHLLYFNFAQIIHRT